MSYQLMELGSLKILEWEFSSQKSGNRSNALIMEEHKWQYLEQDFGKIPSFVLELTNGFVKVSIDSLAHDQLVASCNSPSATHQICFPSHFTWVKSIASLAILLSKLAFSDVFGTLIVLPELLPGSLSTMGSLDFRPLSVIEEEVGILEKSNTNLYGVSAFLNYQSTLLFSTVNVVAALLSEAIQINIWAFNSVDLSDGFTFKEEVGVSSDMMVLFNGSKLVGMVEVKAIHNILKMKMTLCSIVADSLSNILLQMFEKQCISGDDLRSKCKVVQDPFYTRDNDKFVHKVYPFTVAWEAFSVCFALKGLELMRKGTEGAVNVQLDKMSEKRKKVKCGVISGQGRSKDIQIEVTLERLDFWVKDFSLGRHRGFRFKISHVQKKKLVQLIFHCCANVFTSL